MNKSPSPFPLLLPPGTNNNPRLLRKVDFLEWKSDQGHREHDVMRRYHIQDPQTYHKYNKICGSIRNLGHRLALLDPQDPVRRKHEELLLEKLHVMGILAQKTKMSDVENKVTVAAFCRRRLPIIMTRLKMCENVPAVCIMFSLPVALQ